MEQKRPRDRRRRSIVKFRNCKPGRSARHTPPPVPALRAREVLSACDDVFLVLTAPCFHSLWNRTIERVFAQNKQLGCTMTVEQFVQRGGHFERSGKFHLQTGDLKGSRICCRLGMKVEETAEHDQTNAA